MRLIEMAYPTVVKVGSTHAGFGKFVVKSQGEYDDLESIIAMKGDFFTEEPFTKHQYEFRVQVIGPHVRCFRRNSDSSWKNNWGNLRFEDHPWDKKYELWIDEVRRLFGGLDMFAFDVLHVDDTKDVILELNDYAMGLDYDYEAEDLKHMRELVVLRMNELFVTKDGKRKEFIGEFVHSSLRRGDLKGVKVLK